MSIVHQHWVAFCESPSEERFEAFYEKTSGFVAAIARRVLFSLEETDDVIQLVFTDLVALAHDEEQWRAVEDADELVREFTLRHAERMRKGQIRTFARLKSADAIEPFAADLPRADELVMDRQVQDQVATLLDELSDDCRLALVLHFYHKMTMDEVAEALDSDHATISRRIVKGLAQLQERAEAMGLREVLAAIIILAGLGKIFRPPAHLSSAAIYKSGIAKMSLAAAAGKPVTSVMLKMLSSKTVVLSCVAAICALCVVITRSNQTPKNAAATRVSAVRTNPLSRPRAPVNNTGVSLAPQATEPTVSISPGESANARTAVKSLIVGSVLSLYNKAPIDNVTVVASGPGGRFIGNSAPDGSFEIRGVPAGSYSVKFEPPEPWLAKNAATTVTETAAAAMGDVWLARAGRISGQLVDAETRNPIPDQLVELGDPSTLKISSTTTDQRGRFSFSGLTWNNYALILRKFNSMDVNVELNDSETKEIIVPVGRNVVEGNISRNGQNVASASITLTTETESSYSKVGVLSNEQGDFRFRYVLPGTYRMSVVPADPALVHQSVSRLVTISSQVQALDVTLPSVVVTGSLPSVHPGSLTTVAAFSKDSSKQLEPLASAEADSSGKFEFATLPPGPTVFSAISSDGQIGYVTADLPSDGTINIAIPLASSKVGHIVSTAIDLQSRLPIRDAWLRLYKDDVPFHIKARRDEQGKLQLPLPAGDYQYEVSAFGYSTDKAKLQIVAGTQAKPISVLHPAGGVRWRVLDAAGSDVRNAQIELTPIDEDSIEIPRRTTTGEDGIAVQRGLFPGRYTAIVRKNDQKQVESVTIFAKNLSEKVVVFEKMTRHAKLFATQADLPTADPIAFK